MKIGWLLASTAGPDVASTRYRCLYPAMAFEAQGVENFIFHSYKNALKLADQLDALVIVKTLSLDCAPLLQKLQSCGAVTCLDLCDDVLMRGYSVKQEGASWSTAMSLSPYLDYVITPNDHLAHGVAGYGFSFLRFLVVPDTIETPALAAEAERFYHRKISETLRRSQPWLITMARSAVPNGTIAGHLAGKLKGSSHKRKNHLTVLMARYARNPRKLIGDVKVKLYPHYMQLRSKPLPTDVTIRKPASPPLSSGNETALTPSVLARDEARKTVIWFGNHGGPHSDFGLLSLMKAIPALEAVHARQPLRLLIVSNHRGKGDVIASQCSFQVTYVPWSHSALEQALAVSDVFIMPKGNETFSSYKSPNRVFKALQAGVPVVAEWLPSMAGLEKWVFTGDLQGGLEKVLLEGQATDTQAALNELEKTFGLASTSALLFDALKARREKKRQGLVHYGKPNRRFLILIDLLQDVPIALPIIQQALAEGLEPAVIASERALKSSAQLTRGLVKWSIVPTMVTQQEAYALDSRHLRGATLLLTVAETDQGPHRLAHNLVRLANRLGIKTVTLQHGLENIGLTYRDKRYTEAVDVASNTILTWGPIEQVPSWVRPDIRGRMKPVGRVSQLLEDRQLPLQDERPVVAVFENLHWDRYNDEYRAHVLEILRSTATASPQFLFVLKPHPAGKWLSKNNGLEWPENVVIAHPDSAAWAGIGGPSLIAKASCVVTTPSTAALDAAMQGKAVAVFSDGSDLGLFSPLPLIHNEDELSTFIIHAAAPAGEGKELVHAALEFKNRTLIEERAEVAIIDLIKHHMASVEFTIASRDDADARTRFSG